MYCYIEFKVRYLKNLKLFSIRVKELFEPIVLPKKKKKKKKKKGDFYGKKRKIGKGNLYLIENRLRGYCTSGPYF